MKFSSSRRSRLALLLSVLLSLQWAFPATSASIETIDIEPALLLKFASPDIPEKSSREILDSVPERVTRDVRVRWTAAPAEATPSARMDALYPVPDDAALKNITEKISLASRFMERVEDKKALELLSEAEKEIRLRRFNEATRPFLAEIFLRQGILKLRGGDVHGAESLFSRSRALRPGFVPDSALFPPQVVAAWGSVSSRPMPEAEILVQSLPSGAAVLVNGAFAGRTPVKVNPGKTGPASIRVSYSGYRDVEKVGQWFPGDAETLDFSLTADRIARLGDLLSEQGGREAGPLIEELATAAGVNWVAVITLEKDGSGAGYVAKAYSRGKAGGAPVFLGLTPVGESDSRVVGKWLSGRLLENGWPEESKDQELKPWYKSWWVWGIVVVATLGVAAGLAGGSGGGANGSSIGVKF